ncbi:hypothetical protein PSTH1771_01650 [Pseudomonas syringae pv. theae]|uniref:bpX5 domain-containing protein n=1 Tax=Pseudomonas syringae TaxID=317 RepID=UPI001F3D013C|nr:hypothetical protein [Pseudomonas syringae]MBL3831290.1 hypothetical protein [Pseudomonas syringae pv. theae]MBL3834483.1 hypothetical protein [Pseudomonas syringae pv. theae]MBL3865495.1 hypothetical protein [Pseudomonas syringae pv. theae]GKQ45923.1 hypothetical protein PSTH2693_12225 [Pseudomonas syringae pv. theae]GKS03668.1 hypothetical protein PSTH1771_01650 [Pseudomonas syringae pv. theae]
MSALATNWTWKSRRQPGQPQAAVAWGEVALRLHARLCLMPDDQASRLQATANRDLLVVSGDAMDLPWVDGVDYAGSDDRAPGLWLPTSWEPDLPVDLIGQALAMSFSRVPLLLWHDPAAVVPLDRLLPLTAQHLQRIEAYWVGR